MFMAEEYNEKSDGDGSILILRSNRLTPKIAEVLWPRVKNKAMFNKLLKNHYKEDWTQIKIKRMFYESGELTSYSSFAIHQTQ